jgi:aryl-phospho-beta-D-glucosidase BglC (GH1 family)
VVEDAGNRRRIVNSQGNPVWLTGNITAGDLYDAWVWVAQRYSQDDRIIDFDLTSEPHGQPNGRSRRAGLVTPRRAVPS